MSNAAGNTLDDFLAEAFTIVAFCDACEHRAPLDRSKVRREIDIPDDYLQYLSPLGWEHINLTGDYIWNLR